MLHSNWILGLSLLLFIGGSLPVSAEDNLLTAEEAIASMSWITGHWRGADFETIYSSPEGGLILSLSKQYDEHGLATFGEFERFAIVENQVILTPFPGGQQSEHSFPMVSCDPNRNRVEFENLEHDWPTHFVYESPGEDTLHIVVSGPGKDGEVAELEFTLKRVVEAPVVAKSE